MRNYSAKNIILTFATPVVLVCAVIALSIMISSISSVKNETSETTSYETDTYSADSSESSRSVNINPDDYRPSCLDYNDYNSSADYCDDVSVDYSPNVEDIMHNDSYILCGADAVKGLNSSLVTDTGGLGFHYGSDTFRVFGEDRSDFFSIVTSGQLNIWCDAVMSGCFNCTNIDKMTFTLGLEDGTSNNAYVRFYLDDNFDYPVHEIDLQPGDIPKQYSLDLQNAYALTIEVENMASCEPNRAVFYDVTISKN